MARAALAGMLMCVLALVGCSALASMNELKTELESAGYTVSGMHDNTMNGHEVLSIEATMPDAVPTESDADRIAEIVWTKYPPDIDELVITINGQPLMDASADELTDQFGARPASLNDQASGRRGGGVSVTAVIVVAVVALMLAGLVVFVWWRGRKAPPPVAPPAYPGMYPPPYMPQPYQPQVYQPQMYQPQMYQPPPTQPAPPPAETQQPSPPESPPVS